MREAKRPLLPAAQRGLRAAAGRGGGAGRGARRRPAGPLRRRAAARLRRRAGALRLALPRRRHRAGRRPLPASLADRAEQGQRDPPRSTGRSRAPCWSAARPPPRSATWTPPSSSTTTSATSPSGSPRPAGTASSSPAAEAVHHDQLSTDLAVGLPRIVEFHRNRDLYMRKHHGRPAALAVRILTAWSYAVRALAAAVLPSHPAGVYWAHARQALLPAGEQASADVALSRGMRD